MRGRSPRPLDDGDSNYGQHAIPFLYVIQVNFIRLIMKNDYKDMNVSIFIQWQNQNMSVGRVHSPMYNATIHSDSFQIHEIS